MGYTKPADFSSCMPAAVTRFTYYSTKLMKPRLNVLSLLKTVCFILRKLLFCCPHTIFLTPPSVLQFVSDYKGKDGSV